MTLTPEDVHKKTFTPVRLREGYDMGEVDQFLDEVEVELTRLHQENDDLRSKLDDASASAARGREPADGLRRSRRSAPPAPVVRPFPRRPAPRPGCWRSPPRTPTSWSPRRRTSADKIVSEATTKAERLERGQGEGRAARDGGPDPRREARRRDLAAQGRSCSAELERDKDNLARELEDLRAFEREYRSRLEGLLREPAARPRRGDGDARRRCPAPAQDDSAPSCAELLGEDADAAVTPEVRLRRPPKRRAVSHARRPARGRESCHACTGCLRSG